MTRHKTIFSTITIASALMAGFITSSGGTAAASSYQTEDVRTGTLTVQIEVAETAGAVMIALYADAQSYVGGKPFRARRVVMEAKTESVSFEGLPTGRYAIKAFHDLDSNGELTTNPFGAPVEPFAFSNGAQAHYGPPQFDDAAIRVSSHGLIDTLSFVR